MILRTKGERVKNLKILRTSLMEAPVVALGGLFPERRASVKEIDGQQATFGRHKMQTIGAAP